MNTLNTKLTIYLTLITLLSIIIGCRDGKQNSYNFTETNVTYLNIQDSIKLSGTLNYSNFKGSFTSGYITSRLWST